MARRLTLILFLALVAVAGGSMAQYLRWRNAPLPLGEAGQLIEVPAGMPLDALAERLVRDGIIEYAWDLKLLARLRGEAARIQAGEYQLEAGLTLAGLMDKLVSGNVKLYALTVVEGMTAAQLFELMAAHPGIRWTLEQRGAAAVAAALNLPADHTEGWFLPETYHFPRGTTDVEFLRRAHAAMQAALETAWQNRDPGLPVDSPYEALILASIVEKETSVSEERRAIAGVFSRRLERGMRLQTDPTVIYGLGENYDGDIRYRDLRRDTPYNTYTRRGLPPTPICLPSRASIEAVMHPEPGDSLYFVATGDGGHKFSATLEEHSRAVRKYQSRRRPLDPPDERADNGGAMP